MDYYFKPRGIPLSELEEVVITDEELETITLRFIKSMDQVDAANSMNISQSQYQRDLQKALTKITDAIANGKAIRISSKDKD